ncbi:MAG: helix-turn-helix transcriptional regulator [Treponema sp.]|jgi:DNA-binding HxlR family transcriptional regulator|nr:helix-turn-helix transcriptional regulator [Treponema sp.]
MAEKGATKGKILEEVCGNKCPCQIYCPLGAALKLIGGKWKIPILCSLRQDGVTRYNELKGKIKGITNAVLSKTLKELEGDGLVVRKQYPEVPVRVEYTLTEIGSGLAPALLQLAAWGICRKGDPRHKAKLDPETVEF